MPRLLRSTAVRLALGYAVLFVVSSLLLVGFLWWRTEHYLNREIDAVIVADAQAIADRLQDFGLPGAIESVNERIKQASDEHAIYLLADPMLNPVAGNLRAWPLAVGLASGWHQIELVRDGRTYAARAVVVILPGGFRLLVGRDVQDRVKVRALVMHSLAWASAGACVLAILGGMLLRYSVLRRVESINRTANAIIAGDFSRRVALTGSSDEFDQLAQTINRMLQQIEHLIERVRNASNAVAHDLRTPLAELRARLEALIRAGPSSQTVFDEIHQAVADIDHVIDIFNSLMRLAEIDSGVRRSAFSRVDLAEVTSQVAELYSPVAEEKGVSLTVAAPPGITVSGDAGLLAQAIGNLVDNAIKFQPLDGAVSLRVVAPADEAQVAIEVADRGPGIPEPERSRVTEPFYRGDRAAGTEGMGLGLSVVQAVARLHDGDLTMKDNRPGLAVVLRLRRTAPP